MFISDKSLTKAKSLMLSLAVASVGTGMMQSCIDEDGIPYPDIQANFSTFEVRNQLRAARIDTVNRLVTVYLNDSADINAVTVTGYTFSRSDASLVNPAVFDSPVNLSDSFDVMLKVYREYRWTITAQQTIERYFGIEGQVGQSEIDLSNHTVTATLRGDLPIDAVKVDSIKLAGATAVMTPDIAGATVDFTNPVEVEVTEFGKSVTWTITIDQAKVNVSVASVTPWGQVAWVGIDAADAKAVGAMFREVGTLQWTEVAASDLTVESGAHAVALLNGLKPSTAYEVVATYGDELSAIVPFTTEAAPQLPNSRFTDWWLDGKVWCPWSRDGESFWDTGNKGASTLGQSNVLPIDNEQSATGYAGASLQTKFIGISVLGKLGAGSIFSGRYVRTDGTNGILAFGRPFACHPTRVRARVRYKSVPIDYASSEFTGIKGQPDTCIVWCALSDRTETYEIRTNPKTRQLFDSNDPSVIAYGNFQSGESIADYTTVEFKLDYRGVERATQQIVFVCAASKYGDYFTGGSGSVLDVEWVELLYDY